MFETRSCSLLSAAVNLTGGGQLKENLWERRMAYGYETQSKLNALMEGLDIENPGSVLQQAVSGAMGMNIPVDEAFDFLVSDIATSIGLKKTGPQAAVAYVFTKVAILTAAEAIGIGSGFVSLDMTGFALAQIKATVDDIQKKVNAIHGAPQKLAIKNYLHVLNYLQNEQITLMIKEVEKMIDNARTAFVHTTSLDPTVKNLKDAVQVKILEMIAELLRQSVDKEGTKITPFYLLSSKTKTSIANMMEDSLEELKNFKEKIRKKYLGLVDSNRGKAERQDLLDSAYRVAYPFISEAKGKTNPLTSLKSTFTFPVLVKLLPEGASDKTRVTIGVEESEKQRAVLLWRFKSVVKVATWEGAVTEVPFEEDQEEVHVEINFPAQGELQHDYLRRQYLNFFRCELDRRDKAAFSSGAILALFGEFGRGQGVQEG